MNLDANSLIVFCHVAQAGSLSKAARLLNLSRSALSHRIKAIEARLGCQLLMRTTRRIGLTEAGYRLAAHADRMADILRDANLLAHGLNEDATGLVRISAPLALGSVWLTPLLMSYMQANPRVRVDVRFSEQAGDIADDAVDLAIRQASSPPGHVRAQKLFGISWCLCASPDLAQRYAGELADGNLQAVPLAGFSRQRHDELPRIMRGGRLLTGLSEPSLLSDDLDVVRAAVRRSLCIAVMPDYFVREDIVAGRLIDLDVDVQIDGGDGDQVYALHLPGKLLPARVRNLLAFLTQESARQYAHC